MSHHFAATNLQKEFCTSRAAGGTINFTKPNQDVTVVGSPSANFSSPFVGKIVAAGLSVTISQTSGSTDLVLGDIQADNAVTINISSGTSNIIRQDGQITSPTVHLFADRGSIGSILAPIFTSTGLLDAHTSQAYTGGITVRNTSGISTDFRVLNNTVTGGDFDISTSDNLSAGNVSTQYGSISLISRNGQINVDAGASVIANEGNIQLLAATFTPGRIFIGSGATITATTTFTDTNLGNVAISVGGAPQFVNHQPPSNVTVDPPNSQTVYFGSTSIEASSPTNSITLLHQRFVAFDTNGTQASDSSKIHLNGNVQVIASGN